jgi:hypothetical protein
MAFNIKINQLNRLKYKRMLWLMFFLILLKLCKRYGILIRIKNITKGNFKDVILLIAILFLLTKSSSAQNQNLSFEVWKNNMLIGYISMSEKINADFVIYELSSEIKAKVLMEFNVSGIEKTIYNHGVLVYSSVYRKINSNEKTNKELFFKDGKYYLLKGGKKSALTFPEINNNLITLYFYEPIKIAQVYCDNHHKMVQVVFVEKGKYQVNFPDGSYNIFYYENGKCLKVDAFGLLYEVQLISTI